MEQVIQIYKALRQLLNLKKIKKVDVASPNLWGGVAFIEIAWAQDRKFP